MVDPGSIAMLASAGIGAAGSLFGGGNDSRHYRRYGESILQQIIENNRRRYGRAESLMEARIPELKQGFQRARQGVARTESAASQRIADRESQRMASVESDMAKRGLTGTSLLDSARFGASGQTSRELQDLDARLAGLYSNIETGESAALAGAQADLAGFQQARAAAEQVPQMERYSLWSGNPMQAIYSGGQQSPVDAGGLGVLLTGLLGGLGKGGGGGGGTAGPNLLPFLPPMF